MSIVPGYGRLANLIFQCYVMSVIAEKHDLMVEKYTGYDKIEDLGIELYTFGRKTYYETINLKNVDFFNVLYSSNICFNILVDDFFQTKEISNMLYHNLREPYQKHSIMSKNPYKERYGKNNDCFVHIRLTDAEQYNPGIEYYMNAIHRLKSPDKIFVSSDDLEHPMVVHIGNSYPDKVLFVNMDDVETLQFASSCRHLVLSHGSYSAMMGYLGFMTETVFYSSFDGLDTWHGDMFSIPGWIMIQK
jgi:hypothetical protein